MASSRNRGASRSTTRPAAKAAIYVGDDKNYRVQKLSETGSPYSRSAIGVNRTTGGNLSVACGTDDCYTARTGPCQFGPDCPAADLSPGALGGWRCFDGCFGIGVKGRLRRTRQHGRRRRKQRQSLRDRPQRDSQPWEPRIQAFDSSGQFIGQARLPRPVSPVEPTAIGGRQPEPGARHVRIRLQARGGNHGRVRVHPWRNPEGICGTQPV